MIKRRYLNREEKNQMMTIMAVAQQMEGYRNLAGVKAPPMWEDWTNRDFMTKEEKKYLKMAHTYMIKFFERVISRLDEREHETLKKQLIKFDFKLVDDYTMQKIFRDMKDKMKEIVMDRELFYNLCEDIMHVNCRGCNKDGETCPIRAAFEDNMVPEYGQEIPNCKYAYLEIKKKE